MTTKATGKSHDEIERLRELDAHILASEEAADELRSEFGGIIAAARPRFETEKEWLAWLTVEVGFKRGRATAYRWMRLARGEVATPRRTGKPPKKAPLPLESESLPDCVARLAPKMSTQELVAARDALVAEIQRRQLKAAS